MASTRRASNAAGDNVAAARKMLSTLPGVESDGGTSSLDALSDSGEDDPELSSRRPAGPAHRDGPAQPQKSDGSVRPPTSSSLNQPGNGPISVASDFCKKGSKHSKEKGEIIARDVPRSSNVSNLPQNLAQTSGSKHVSAPESNRSSTGSHGDRTSANMKKAQWKQDAIQEGMRLVEKERQQSAEMHHLLCKRIEFLTEELENTRSELNIKARECDELQDVVMELDKELTRETELEDDSDGEEVSSQVKAQSWLERLQENLQISASKAKASKEEASPSRVCAVPSIFNMPVKLEMPTWLSSLSPQKGPTTQQAAVTSASFSSETTPSKPKEAIGDGRKKKEREQSSSEKKRFQLC